MKRILSAVAASSALIITAAIVPQTRAMADGILAKAEYGIRYIGRSSLPSNCTAGRTCTHVDASAAPQLRYYDGTADNYVPACLPTTTGDVCSWDATAGAWVRGAGGAAVGLVNGVINVKDAPYNAVGDGTTDDTAAIQAAIQAAIAGSTVYFPTGTYNLVGSGSQLLLVDKPLHIVCGGWGTTLEVAATVPNTRDVIHVTAPSANVGFSIENCAIGATLGAARTITAATNATPISIMAASHGFSTGDTVIISGVGGNTNANGTWVVTVVDANTFTLNGSVGNAAYTTGGTAKFVPGRHGINLDVSGASNPIQNVVIAHDSIGQLGGRAIVTSNTAPLANGVFLVDIRDNVLRGGIDLSNAGDSILIKGNTITGGFNAIDVGLVPGAHALAIEDNNVTSQGCFLEVSSGLGARVFHNNAEPGASGTYGVDTSNCANGATLDMAGSAERVLYNWQIYGNHITNWANNSTNGDVIRADYTQGAIIENNEAVRSVAGPHGYVITAHADGTYLSIPITDDGGTLTNKVSDSGTHSIVHYYGLAGTETYGGDGALYTLRVYGGSGQTSDIFDVQTNSAAHLLEINAATPSVLVAGATDNGYPFHIGGPTYFDARAVFGGGYVWFGDGSSASVSTAGTGAIRYNNTTHTIQQSVNGGAWTDIGSAGGGTLATAYSSGSSTSDSTMVCDATRGAVTAKYQSIGTAQTAALAVVNTSSATSGSPQNSPGIQLSGTQYNGTSSVASDVMLQAEPVDGSTLGPPLSLYGRYNGGSWAKRLMIALNSGGNKTRIYRDAGSGMIEMETSELNLYYSAAAGSPTAYVASNTMSPYADNSITSGNSSSMWSSNWSYVYATKKGADIASASTISPTSGIHHVTGTSAINTINLPVTGFVGSIVLIPDGAFTTGTSGNIAIASTAVVGKALQMTYDGTKWYPSY